MSKSIEKLRKERKQLQKERQQLQQDISSLEQKVLQLENQFDEDPTPDTQPGGGGSGGGMNWNLALTGVALLAGATYGQGNF